MGRICPKYALVAVTASSAFLDTFDVTLGPTLRKVSRCQSIMGEFAGYEVTFLMGW